MWKRMRGMMPGPRELCRCGTLAKLAAEPGGPVIFVKPTGEYRLMLGDPEGGYVLIRFCPVCGGGAYPGDQEQVGHLTNAEKHRLIKLTEGLSNLADVRGRLGVADYDSKVGTATTRPKEPGICERTEVIRVLRYERLSASADVIVVERIDGSVAFGFETKLGGGLRREMENA